MSTVLKLDESERQMVLMALAHLAVERPGWEYVLHDIALRIDNAENHRAVLFDEFRAMHREAGQRV